MYRVPLKGSKVQALLLAMIIRKLTTDFTIGWPIFSDRSPIGGGQRIMVIIWKSGNGTCNIINGIKYYLYIKVFVGACGP